MPLSVQEDVVQFQIPGATWSTLNGTDVDDTIHQYLTHTHNSTASVEHIVVQPTGCMDIALEPSRGIVCQGLPRKTDQLRVNPTQTFAPRSRCHQCHTQAVLRHLSTCDQPYPELCTKKPVSSMSHSGSAPTSLNMRSTLPRYVTNAYRPPPPLLPHPNPP